MSQANAAAIKRRANITPPQAKPGQVQASPVVNTSGLTLPQVIAVIDKRLVQLESFMQDTRNQPTANVSETTDKITSNFINLIEEYNDRFELLAEEIVTMKDMVLKLQSFTMDVNKTLMDERIHIFSDLSQQSPTSSDSPVEVESEVIEPEKEN